MTEGQTPEPLDDLGARLKAIRARSKAKSQGHGLTGGEGNLLGMAFRFGVELVSALAVGLGIGYLLDRWLGTSPWMMVMFFFLGAAAGMLNVYRATLSLGMAGPGASQGEAETRSGKDEIRRD
ncbi:MAG: AtpZ/AtpI family protein [Proteobacteria bacterium]|nr:AtpZ/AtpI family protein [Pseudomonadota bacterium]